MVPYLMAMTACMALLTRAYSNVKLAKGFLVSIPKQ